MTTFNDSFKNIFVIYLIISANFLANLFGCRTQYILTNNMLIKHLLGFMTMYFFVVLVDDKSKISDTPGNQLLFTILFYIGFLLTTRMDFKWLLTLIITLSIFYILQVYKDHEKTSDTDKKKYELYQTYLSYFMIAIVTLGFFIYLGRKKIEYKNNFNFTTFMLGKTNCTNNQDGNYKVSDYKALIKSFN